MKRLLFICILVTQAGSQSNSKTMLKKNNVQPNLRLMQEDLSVLAPLAELFLIPAVNDLPDGNVWQINIEAVSAFDTTMIMNRLLLICALVALVKAQSNSEAIFKNSNDRFSAKMLQAVKRIKGDNSYVLSAFSVLSPLAELALASVGETHDEILKAVELSNDNVTKQVFSDLNSRLQSLKGVDLELANKLYIAKEYSLDDQFAALSKKVFNSEIENIDFEQKEKAVAEINAWVENHTRKHVSDIISSEDIDKDTAALLVNAIYFKGKWKKPFDKSSTVTRSFHVTKKLTSPVPMMFQTENFKYTESKRFSAKFLEMEYEGSDMSLIVALPNKVDGINKLIQKFKDPSVLNKVIKDMKSYHVRVHIPKFKIQTTTNLVDVLKKLNIKQLFDERRARLSNLLEEKKHLYINEAKQKAFIEVNEEGAEAAVVNYAGVAVNDALEEIYYPYVPEFNANHPFLFFVMEQNNILFSGVYRS